MELLERPCLHEQVRKAVCPQQLALNAASTERRRRPQKTSLRICGTPERSRNASRGPSLCSGHASLWVCAGKYFQQEGLEHREELCPPCHRWFAGWANQFSLAWRGPSQQRRVSCSRTAETLDAGLTPLPSIQVVSCCLF